MRSTVFGNVTNDMVSAREKIFGPVLSLIAIANDTPYGLHACVFGADVARAQSTAAEIVAWRVSVNGLYDAPEAPFGGFKQSSSDANLAFSVSKPAWNRKRSRAMTHAFNTGVLAPLLLLLELHLHRADSMCLTCPSLGHGRRSCAVPRRRRQDAAFDASFCLLV